MIRIATAILICALALCVAGPCIGLAAEQAIVNLAPPEKKQYWVGQRIGFAIELLAIGQFSGAPKFELPKLPGVIVMKVDQRPTLSTKVVNGESYVAQRHDFTLFAQRSGTCVLPAFTVRFDSKEAFDKPVSHNRLATEPLEVTVRLPDGAQPGAPVVSATELTVDEKWKPEPGQAKVGDALTRTISIKASDVPGMLLPEPIQYTVDGLQAYRKEPRIEDSEERGDLIGRRIESITYVCGKPGDYRSPELVFRRWNVDQEAWEESRCPSVDLKVSPNPALANESRSGKASKSSAPEKGNKLTLFVIMGVLLVGLFAAIPWGFKTLSALRQRWLQSKAGLFAQFANACRQGRAADADRTLTLWLEAQGLSREQLQGIASSDNVLNSELRSLQEALIGNEPSWNGSKLAKSLRRIREKRIEIGPGAEIGKSLPPLNPVARSSRSGR